MGSEVLFGWRPRSLLARPLIRSGRRSASLAVSDFAGLRPVAGLPQPPRMTSPPREFASGGSATHGAGHVVFLAWSAAVTLLED